MREDWIRSNTVAATSDDDVGGYVDPVDDVLGTYNAESLRGGMA